MSSSGAVLDVRASIIHPARFAAAAEVSSPGYSFIPPAAAGQILDGITVFACLVSFPLFDFPISHSFPPSLPLKIPLAAPPRSIPGSNKAKKSL